MKSRIAVGIDPGGRYTGVVLMVDGELRNAWTVDRLRCEPMVPTTAQLVEVLETIDLAAARGLEFAAGGRVTICVEDLVAHESNPSMRQKTTAPLVATGAIIAAVLVSFPAAVRVEPGGNGSGPLEAYPVALRPTRGSGKGADQLRHCRSAWDVALAGMRLARHGAVAS